ncbi:MAG: hypothetical protein ABIT08_00245, partial [Bacteroidia bacterium]
MKKLFTIVSILLLINLFVKAQNNVTYSDIPGVIGYSAIAYTSQGIAVANQNITLRASIIKGSITGSVEYQETHSITTRNDGSFDIPIGEGIWTAGTYQTINDVLWGNDHYFLKMEIDASGGYNFGDAGTEAFCSVPYAFHSSVADSLNGVSSDTLRMAIAAVNVCGCTLQSAYDNVSGNSITTNVNGSVVLRGSSLSIGPILDVKSTNPFNLNVAEFRITNGT